MKMQTNNAARDPIAYLKSALIGFGVPIGPIDYDFDRKTESSYIVGIILGTVKVTGRFINSVGLPNSVEDSDLILDLYYNQSPRGLYRKQEYAGFDFSRHGLDYFGEDAKNIWLELTWHTTGAANCGIERLIVRICQDEAGIFEIASYDPKIKNDPFSDIPRGYRDFRPYLQRVAELYAGISKSRWVKAPNPDEDLAKILGAFFSGEQLATIQRKISRAGLRGSLYESVPRLNLGMTSFGAPNASENYCEAGDFLVRVLGESGIMQREHAAQIVSKKVVNLVMQRTQFQHSPKTARKILEELVGNE